MLNRKKTRTYTKRHSTNNCRSFKLVENNSEPSKLLATHIGMVFVHVMVTGDKPGSTTKTQPKGKYGDYMAMIQYRHVSRLLT